MRALAHDLPMLVIPASALSDQRLIARAVADAGAGLALRRSASVTAVRTAITALLTEPRWREAAARIGAQIRTADAARTAAAMVVELACAR